MATITHDPTGRHASKPYCAKIRRKMPDGSMFRASERFTSREKAEAWAKKTEEEAVAAKVLARKGLLPEPKPATPTRTRSRQTLSTFAESFWSWLAGSERPASPSTIAGYKSHWRSSVAPMFADFTLAELTPAVVEHFRMGLIKDGRKAGPVMAVLSSILSLAVERDLLDHNPCIPKVRVKRRRTGARSKPATKVMTAAQRCCTLMGFPPGRERVAYVLAAYCGLRLGEARGLRPEDCHLDDEAGPWLHIRNNVVRGEGKMHDRPPKDGEVRVVPLWPGVAKELGPWVRFKRRYVLADVDGGPWRGDGGGCKMVRELRTAQTAAGVTEYVCFQHLRATFVTCEIARGVPREIVKAIVGHSLDLRDTLGEDVTDRHYLRLSLGELRGHFR